MSEWLLNLFISFQFGNSKQTNFGKSYKVQCGRKGTLVYVPYKKFIPPQTTGTNSIDDAKQISIYTTLNNSARWTNQQRNCGAKHNLLGECKNAAARWIILTDSEHTWLKNILICFQSLHAKWPMTGMAVWPLQKDKFLLQVSQSHKINK